MADCTQGVEIRRIWSEREMVRSFGGQLCPGTPDGMFESWDGTLTCVQVVRVPLTAEMSLQDIQETLRITILTKVVKSQHWLKASNVAPQNFIIFCWLPFAVHSAGLDASDAVMQRVQDLDARFSLRLRVPPEVGSLFPALFACNQSVEAQRIRSFSWEDVTTYIGNESMSDEDDDEFCAWDMDLDWAAVLAEDVNQAEEGCAEDLKEDPEWEWDIAWAEESEHLSQTAVRVIFSQLQGTDGSEDATTHSQRDLGAGSICRTLWDDNG